MGVLWAFRLLLWLDLICPFNVSWAVRYGFRSVLAFSVKGMDAVVCRFNHVASSCCLGESGSGGGLSSVNFRGGDSVALGGVSC